MKVLFTLIGLVLAYVVGLLHLAYIIRKEVPVAWMVMQMKIRGFECSITDKEKQEEGETHE